ncbi:MAG: tRNA pseudouridine(38-40) synthase TruA [Jiangellaceae bacterium]
MQPAATESGGRGLLRLRLDLSYDGAGFSGWATQPGRRTLQETLGQALGVVLRTEPPRLVVAGRTDAGVHARGQVCHVDVPVAAWEALPGRTLRPPDEALVRRLAGVLPTAIRVYGATVAPEGFDARFSALWRRYAYRVADTVFGADPLRRGTVLWHPRPLDVDAMNDGAAGLTGEQDFAAFCRPREGATTIRTLQALRCDRAEGGLVVVTAQADAFCHNQVRAMVGALLIVGDGRRPADWPARVLAARVRDPSVPVVPAHGLTLEAVGYPPDDEVGRRADDTRHRRARRR